MRALRNDHRTGTLLRDYADEVDGVRVIYYVTALRAVVAVAYIEV
ncbi:hypothetical protein [Streptomyces sp. A5-4]